MSKHSGWIGFDLDGTLAVYDGWQGPTHIGDPIEPMVERAKAYLASGVEVRIFTARVCQDQDGMTVDEIRSVIQDWTEKHLGQRLPVTNIKDFSMVTLYDDRAVQVEKNTGRMAEL